MRESWDSEWEEARLGGEGEHGYLKRDQDKHEVKESSG